MEHKYRGLVLNKKDNVATALLDLPAKEEVHVTGEGISFTVYPGEKIPFGFKFATRDINRGEAVLKYGESIGEATEDITAGSLVHIHNIAGTRGRGDLCKS